MLDIEEALTCRVGLFQLCIGGHKQIAPSFDNEITFAIAALEIPLGFREFGLPYSFNFILMPFEGERLERTRLLRNTTLQSYFHFQR